MVVGLFIDAWVIREGLWHWILLIACGATGIALELQSRRATRARHRHL